VAQDLRPLGIGDVFDVSLRLYLRHWTAFLTVMLVGDGLVLPAVSLALERFLQPLAHLPEGGLEPGALARALTGDWTRVGPLAGLVALNLLVLRPLVEGAVIAAAGSGHLDGTAGFGAAYRRAGRRFGVLAGALGLQVLVYLGVLAVAAVLGGALALVSPWLALAAGPLALGGLTVLGLQFCFVAEAVVLEGLGPLAALGRSRRLARGHYGRITLLYLLGIAATLLLGKLLAMVAALVAPGSAFLGTLAEMLATVLAMPLSWVSFVVLYYDLRVRKEGLDLERLADRVLGDAAAAA
jgi:hypothetical protein